MTTSWDSTSRILLRLQLMFLGIALCLWVFFLLVGIRSSFWAVAGFTFLNGNLSAIPFATLWPRLFRKQNGPTWIAFLAFLVSVAVLSSAFATWVLALLYTGNSRDIGLRTFVVGMLITIVTGIVTRTSEQSRRDLLEANLLLEQAVAIGKVKLDSQEADLRAAHDIQARLLPRDLPLLLHASVACAWQPAQSVGGDYFDVLPLASGKVAFCMADVCGKGISAALLMANVQAAFRAFAPDSADVGSLCSRLNRTLCQVTGPARFVTFYCGVFDPLTRLFEYENAGHPPPLLLRGEDATPIAGGGMVLGLFPEAGYESRFLQLDSGDCIVIATDGILEAANQHGEEFGEQRLAQCAKAAALPGAEAIQQHVMESVAAFCDGQFEDDASLMVILIA